MLVLFWLSIGWVFILVRPIISLFALFKFIVQDVCFRFIDFVVIIKFDISFVFV